VVETNSSQSLDGGRLLGLQVLRFFAALLILMTHGLHEGATSGFLNPAEVGSLLALPFGYGIDIFFVISGFIMCFVAGDNFGQPGAPRAFIFRRLVRLVPIYWLFTLLMLAATLVVPSMVGHAARDPSHIAASFTFIPWANDTGEIHPLLGPGWTLNYEMFFYAAFALALFLPARIGLAALVALFTFLVTLHPLITPSAVQLKFWSDPIIFEFLFGIAIAIGHRRGVTLMPILCFGLIAIGVAVMLAPNFATFAGPYQRLLLGGLPAVLIVTGFAFVPFAARSYLGRALVLCGDASYALYLSHAFSINIVALALRRSDISPGWVFLPLAIAASIFAAILVHVLLERPTTRWLNGLGAGGAHTGRAAGRPAQS
jgi:exopolysaccharide production protein ExoZ